MSGPVGALSSVVGSLRGGGPDGEGVGLRVEDVAVQAEQLRVVAEQQVEVLERLAQEEALHLVPWTRVGRVAHVVDGGVAALGDLQGATGCYASGWSVVSVYGMKI